MASFAETRKKRVEEGSTGSSSGNSGGTSKKQNENTNTGAGGFRAARIAELNRRNKSKDDFEPYETTWTPDELKNSGAQLAAATRQAWTPERIERSRQRTTYTIPEQQPATQATRERPDNFLSNLMEGYTQRRLEKLKADQLRDQLNERRQATDLFRADRERIEAAKTEPARQSSYLDLDEYRRRLEGMRQEQAERDEQERRNLIYGIVQDTMDGNRAITPYSEMAGTPEYERAVQTGQSMRHGLPEQKYLGNEPGYFLRNDQTYYMTDAERDAYNYLLASRGTDTAKQYLDALKGDLDTRAAEAQHEAARNIGRTMPVRGSLYDTFLSTVAAPAGGLYLAGKNLLFEDFFNTNDVDPNARQFEGARMEEATREGLKENRIPFLAGKEIPILGGDASDFAWDTGLSILQSVVRRPLGNYGLGLAGLGAASSGYVEARDRGASNERAMLTATLQGAAEAAFEKYSLEGLQFLQANPADSFRGFLINLGKQAFTEGSEEVFTEIANTITDTAVMGELSQYNQDLLTYQAQGVPEEEAKQAAFVNILKRIGLAGLGGAVSGGVMGGGAQALGMAGEQMYYNDIGQSFNPDFRQYAERIITDPNEYANEEDWQEATRLQGLAQEYAERQRNRETIPARERGQYAVDFARMAETSERNLQEQAVKNALDSLVKEGDERADQDMDPEEAVAEPEGKDQISEANDQIPEENDQLTAENDQIPAEYAQEPEQEYLDQMADEYGQEAEEWYPEEPEGWEPEEIIDQTNPAPGTDMVEEYAGINRGTDQTDRVSAIAESMNQGPVVETNTRQAAMSEIETELAENNRQRAGILSEQFGQNGQKAFQDNYDGSMDPGLYSRAFGRAYDAGRYDVDMSIAERSALLSSLGSEQVEAAYLAGLKDREATYRMNDDTGEIKDLRQGAKKTGGLGTVGNGATSEQRAVASHVGKLTGLTIDLVEGSGESGGRASYGGGRITIDINSDDFMGDMSHELTHFIRDYSPDLYRMYEDRAVQALMASRNESLDTMIESYQTAYEQAGQNLTRDQVMEEIVADAAQSFLNDEEFIQEAAKGNKTVSDRIVQFINDVLDALKRMIKNVRERKAAAVLREDIRTLEYARTMWLAALEEGSERYRSGQEMVEGQQTTERNTETSESTQEEAATDDQENIREQFRLEGVDDSRSEKIIEALLLENKNLNEALEHYKHELELTSGEELRQEDIKKVGKKLLHNYKSGYDEEKLAKQLTRIYEYLRSGDKDAINVQDVAEIATALGRSILMKSQDIDKTMLEQYKDVRKQIRDTKIYLDQQDRADLDSRGGYNKFRRDNFGKIKLGNGGMSVDSFYQMLSANNPELFPIEIATPADQLMRIADVMDFTAGQMQNPYYANMDEMSYIVGQEILDAYFDVRNVPPTFADKKAQERDRIRDQYKAKIEQYKKELRSQAMRAMNQIQKQNEGMVIAAERKVERAELAMAAMEQRHMKRTQDMRDRQQANADKKIIMKEAKALSDWLLKPTDKKHIPDALRIPVAEFLKGIDFSSDRSGPEGGPTQRTMQWRDLTDTLDAIIKAEGVLSDQGKDYFIDLDPDLSERIKEIAKKTQGLEKLDRLDPYDMSELKKTVYAMKKALTEANQLKSNKKATEVGKLADGVFGDLNSRKGRIEFTGVIGGVDRLINYDMLDSYTMFHSMGENMGSLQESLRSGLDTKTRLVKIASDHTENLLSTLGFKKSDINEITGSNAKATTFKVKGGEISLTVAQVMSLYELEKRGQSRDHIYNPFGGIKQAPRVSKAKWVNGKLVPGQIIRQYSPVSVSKEDVRNIINTLTPEQKALADGLQKFMGDECAKWGNQVTMEMYGYNKFTAKNYFPIVTDKNYISTKDGDLSGQQLSTIKNMGITKATVQHANNPIIIEDIFDVFTRQVDQMSSYNAYVIPLSDMQKVFNFKDMQGGGSVKQEIERTFGPEGNRYIQQLMVSINGTLNTDRSLGEAMMSNMKAASVAGNLRVAIQQPTAYIRAMAEIDSKYLLRGAATITEKEQWDRICKYAPIAQWKDWGFYRMEVGRQLKDIMFGTDSKKQAFVNLTMFLAERGDKLAWNRLWRACEYETMDLHPELERGSEEFYTQVGQRFSEIVDKTQVVDSVIHRTQIMRSQNALNKMATAFMGEPLKSYNMLYRATIDLISGKKGSKTNAARVAATYLATATATALAASVIDAFRDDDRDKRWAEKYREAFFENLIDGVYIINNIPYAKELESFRKGYSASRSDVAWMQDLVYAWNRIQKLYYGESQYTPQAVAVYTAQQLSKVLGIPIKNLSRIALGIIDSAVKANGGALDYGWIRQQYDIKNSKNLSMYVNMMNDAYRSGNKELQDIIRSDLNKAGFTNDDIRSKSKSLIKSELVSQKDVHPLIDAAANAKIEMDLQTYDNSIEGLAMEGYSYTIIDEAVQSRIDQIEKKEEVEEEPDQEPDQESAAGQNIMEGILKSGSEAGGRPNSTTGYTFSDAVRSIELFDQTPASLNNFRKITSEIVAAKTADGSRDEKDVTGDIKSAITKKYKPMWISGDQKTRQEIQQKLMYLKVGERTLYSSDDWSSWMKAAKKN